MSRQRPPRRSRGVRPLTPQDIARSAALKRFREESGITQEELAGRLEVSQGTLSDWERARKPIPEEKFARLLQVAQSLRDQTAREQEPAETVRVNETTPGGFQTADAPSPDQPPDFGEVSGALRSVVTGQMSPVYQAMLPDVQMVYASVGMFVGRFEPGVGEILQARAPDLAVALCGAAESNAFVARVVALMQIGPVSTCVILHVTVALEIMEYLRRKAQAEAAQGEQAEPPPPAAPPAEPPFGPEEPAYAPAAGGQLA